MNKRSIVAVFLFLLSCSTAQAQYGWWSHGTFGSYWPAETYSSFESAPNPNLVYGSQVIEVKQDSDVGEVSFMSSWAPLDASMFSSDASQISMLSYVPYSVSPEPASPALQTDEQDVDLLPHSDVLSVYMTLEDAYLMSLTHEELMDKNWHMINSFVRVDLALSEIKNTLDYGCLSYEAKEAAQQRYKELARAGAELCSSLIKTHDRLIELRTEMLQCASSDEARKDYEEGIERLVRNKEVFDGRFFAWISCQI